ncbi:adenine-specific DNA methylase [Lactobacillus taiwanensis]|uniref:adenine-specific DNA methylase n=1 Tax=Lactobacillus taiwanensis TaxID=508451 RepID=UPI00241E3D5D|nr:adenine-specific DNA methylase [Lactobacillus taiwanensis]
MKIEHAWAMPNKDTFKIKPIRELLNEEVKGSIIIDPFSNGERKYATETNDLNPNVDADHHLDAYDWLKTLPNNYADIVLYDPPYSLRQVSESYHNVGRQVTMVDTQSSWRRKHLDEIARILKTGGKCISFGWNSNGVGKKRSFKIFRVLIVAHGGMHNDTIVTCEKKIES